MQPCSGAFSGPFPAWTWLPACLVAPPPSPTSLPACCLPKPSPACCLQVGQRLRAKIVHVDAAEDKRRIFLSIRRTTSNPLLETLDSLVTASAAAASATAGGGPSSSHGDGPGSRPDSASDSDAGAPAGAPLDQRAALGDLPETLRFCELLLQGGRGAVTSAVPGVRLQSRAASQELEVYLVRHFSLFLLCVGWVCLGVVGGWVVRCVWFEVGVSCTGIPVPKAPPRLLHCLLSCHAHTLAFSAALPEGQGRCSRHWRCSGCRQRWHW